MKGRKTIRRDMLHLIESLCFLPLWHLQRFIKRDPNLWTFGAWSGLRYSDNSRVLYEHVLANHPEIRCVWMTRNKDVYEKLRAEGKPVALCTSREGKRIQRRAGYFFMTSNRYDSDFRQMNGIRFINLWHGMPLKKIGEDAIERVREKGIWKQIKTRIRKRIIPWEFLSGPTISGSPFFVPFLQSAFMLREQDVYLVPEPRLSRLNGKGGEALITNLNAQYNNPTKVLYMPTFRDDKIGKFNPFEMAEGFDRERYEELLRQKNIVLMYKGHFLDDVKATVSNEGRIRIIGDDDYTDLYRLLNEIDVLITDYSSIYFDFLCLRKPIILFPFDMDDYLAHSREFYFNYNLMGAKKVYSWGEMEECLRLETYYPPLEEEMQRFRPLSNEDSCEDLFKIITK